ncbi:hypothetical protein [Agrobacterium larrymoorei]|uniref:GtrA family protein n=1 Tax=Agrobacterium larrymoorei TaxID=160699 RepID=A0AAF0HE67_9HYPH|nr:hypothetical protein [Agrobacterium larrymoorei]WHA42950.1 hypothetical protein CFBP5477_016925 [Agrobacterium larrymoorei]
MKTVSFLLFYAACAAVDAGLTWLFLWSGEISVLVARAFGAASAITCFVFVQRRFLKKRPVGPLLAGSIGTVSTIVSYGLFALLLSRNPLLQWYVPFLAATLAALILCGLGYWRASKISAVKG